MTGYLGWFNARPERDVGYDEWYNESLLTGIAIGRYWTDHLKTEVEFAATTEDELFRPPEPDFVGRVLYHPASTAYYSTRSLSVVQSYQLFRNQWVHPLLGAGLDVTWDRQRAETGPVFNVERVGNRFVETTLRPGVSTEAETRVRARATASAGLKAYVTERAYVRTDFRIASGKHIDRLVWRFGVGFDF